MRLGATASGASGRAWSGHLPFRFPLSLMAATCLPGMSVPMGPYGLVAALRPEVEALLLPATVSMAARGLTGAWSPARLRSLSSHLSPLAGSCLTTAFSPALPWASLAVLPQEHGHGLILTLRLQAISRSHSQPSCSRLWRGPASLPASCGPVLLSGLRAGKRDPSLSSQPASGFPDTQLPHGSLAGPG